MQIFAPLVIIILVIYFAIVVPYQASDVDKPRKKEKDEKH